MSECQSIAPLDRLSARSARLIPASLHHRTITCVWLPALILIPFSPWGARGVSGSAQRKHLTGAGPLTYMGSNQALGWLLPRPCLFSVASSKRLLGIKLDLVLQHVVGRSSKLVGQCANCDDCIPLRLLALVETLRCRPVLIGEMGGLCERP